MDSALERFRAQVTEFDQTMDGLRVLIRETRTVADGTAADVAALKEFQDRAENANLRLQADIASARATAQDVDAKLGRFDARLGNIEELRAGFKRLKADVVTLDVWRRRFRRILEGVDE